MNSSANRSAAIFFYLATFFTLVAGLAVSTRLVAQTSPDVSGTWRGTLVAGQFDPLEIIFHIHGDAGNYTATVDIPTHSRIGLPVDNVSVRGANIMLRMSGIEAEYYGGLVMSEDGHTVSALNGDWGQSGEHIPLRMHRDAP